MCNIVGFMRAPHGDSLSLAILSVPARICLSLLCGYLLISLCLSDSPTLSLFLSKRRGRDECEVTQENERFAVLQVSMSSDELKEQ